RDRDTTPETTAEPPSPDAGPDKPTHLPKRSWLAAVKNTVKEFSNDNATDWAAALTYYGVLSIFPAMLVLVSLVGVVGEGPINAVKEDLIGAAPASVRDILEPAIERLQQNQAAGLAAIIGLLAAFWAASGYIGAFMRASNAMYDVPEGRPFWKTIPLRLGITALVGVLLVVSAGIVVVTGPVAEWVGDQIGIGSAAVTTWNILKWPVLVVLVSLMIAVLYYVSPNARRAGFRWVTPGSILAVILWIAASAGFAFYAANFASYGETYGTIAGVIVFLVWLWITNNAILFGAEFDAELERQRAISAGYEDGREPFLQLRDDRKVTDEENVTRAT
ncbi:MAG TPA: YihY/virulence factor BrkB family protein, partial [Micromonosporaceae bacterium]|nr:YihY/virulence factor BrkB family protein [Micromonosporaceae bacterium]